MMTAQKKRNPSNQIIVSSGCALLIMTFVSVHSAHGQSVEEFYKKNNQITMTVGYKPGGTYDAAARLIAAYMPRYLPGQPKIIVKNVPGAGSARAANFLYKQAPRDGTSLGAIGQSLIVNQVFKYPGVEFDLTQFNWIGRLSTSVELSVVWNPSPVQTVEDAKKHEIPFGAASAAGSSARLPRVLNRLLGTKFKIVPGYGGMDGIALAIERGEVAGGHSTTNFLLAGKGDWLEQKKVTVLVQYSQDRHPKFPNVPTIVDLGRNAEEKKILSIYGSMADVGRTVLAPPDVPSDKTTALRAAFEKMVNDPTFANEVQKRGIEFQPMTGADLQRRVQETFDISPAIADRASKLWAGNKK
jgi:tripartite-type tricarboxylate transporter receptor subunit TctC